MQTVERYRTRAIIHHWWIVVWALLLGLTGIFLFVPWFSPAAAGGWSRLAHRISAVLFVAGPVIYALFNSKNTLQWIKETLTWKKADLGWLKAAPSYYFGSDAVPMPPQERSNTGQKLWMLVALTAGMIFVITGAIMWFFKDTVSAGVFQWSVFVHDLAFIFAGSMFLVHVALGAFHPRFPEALRSMITGKVSREYAQSHHGKWYEEISNKEKN